jgi:soluble lytic murein transglycosylase-like protein
MYLLSLFLGLTSATTAFSGNWGHAEIQFSAKQRGLDPALVMAFAEVESDFNPKAIRFEPKFQTYSVGMFQLFYPTAKMLGFKGTIKGLMDPKVNTELALIHIKQCTDRFESVSYIACCYNAGVAVKTSVCQNNEGVKNYIQKILKARKRWLERLSN